MPDPETARPDRRKPAVPEHADPTLVPERSEPGEGRLADVAPTLLDLLGLPQPAAMTGHSLIQRG